MAAWHWLVWVGASAALVAACGPDHRPELPCEGPSFNLIVRAERGPLPRDTRINVRYGGNPDGEPYQLGHPRTPQAVLCREDSAAGGASSTEAPTDVGDDAGGAFNAATDEVDVFKLRCGLFTQGPARLDVTATGYEPIKGEELAFGRERHCEVDKRFVLLPLVPDADM